MLYLIHEKNHIDPLNIMLFSFSNSFCFHGHRISLGLRRVKSIKPSIKHQTYINFISKYSIAKNLHEVSYFILDDPRIFYFDYDTAT